MNQQTLTRLTATAYFQSEAYAQHDLIELIDGEIVFGMPPIPKHQLVVAEILYLLMSFARQHGGRAYPSPIEVYLSERHVYEPDVVYLTAESQCEVGDKRLVGAPELVVEVLSPSTAKYDRGRKFATYEQHGVREYWIVDPAHDVVEVYYLQANTFTRLGVYDARDRFTSQILAVEVAAGVIFGVSPDDEQQ